MARSWRIRGTTCTVGSMPALRFELDPLTSETVRTMIANHLVLMRSQSPACSVHALEIERLQAPDIEFWSAWMDDELVGGGALKQLSATEGELKSMHVLMAWRGRGLASQILAHLEARARAAGLSRLSLETGSQDTFEPARRFYTKHGYAPCGPFDTYDEDPNSAFMTKAL